MSGFSSRTQGVAGVLLACALVYQLRSLASKVAAGSSSGRCSSDTSAPYSLDNDCFRLGIAWPLVNYLLATLIFATNFISAPSKAAGPASSCELSGVKDLPGIIFFDNRLHVGSVVLLFSAINLLIPAVLLLSPASKDILNYHIAYWQSLLLFWSAAVYALAKSFRQLYASQNRFGYVGLFSLSLTVAIALQVAVCVVSEFLFLFFSDEPIWGAKATMHTSSIVAATAVSCAVVTALLFVHRRAFVLPADSSVRANMVSANIDSIDPRVDITEYTSTLSSVRKDTVPLVMSPEQSMSLFDFLTFSWINPILQLSRNNQIGSGDLYHLDIKDMPYTFWHRFSNHRRNGRSMPMSLALTFFPQLLVRETLTLLSNLLGFGRPFFMQMLLKSIQDHHDKTSSSDQNIVLYAIGLVIVVCLESLIDTHTSWYTSKLDMKEYSLLVAELTSKVINRCSYSAKSEEKDAASDDQKSKTASDGKVINILTSDLWSVLSVVNIIIGFVQAPISLCIGIWYLYSLLGVSALIGLAVSILQYPLNQFLLKFTLKYRRKLAAINDERVSLITEIFKGIRAVKLFGWQSKFEQQVREKREDQLNRRWKLWMVQKFIDSISDLISSLTLISILGVYSGVYRNRLTADVIFTAITLFRIVEVEIDKLQQLFDRFASCYISYGRVKSFMKYGLVQPIEARVGIDSVADVIGFENASFEWSADNRSQAPKPLTSSSSTTLAVPTEQAPLLPASADNDSDCSATPDSDTCDVQSYVKDQEFSLKDITLRFPVGGFSIIAGPTGSGKSSLLSALVGEMHLTSGRILIPTANGKDVDAHNADKRYREIAELSNWGLVATDIAYVSQEAWLRNATIRDNILFGEPYIQERYEEVLRVCALKPDLRIFKAGDMTEVGERGITLSGGQKQRVALARAVYSSRRILLIDDCLSAVDAHTGKHILHSCLLGQTDLMRGRTRILVTHHTATCLPYSDYAVMLQNGRVAFSGAPAQMQSCSMFSSEVCGIDGSENSHAKENTANDLDSWTESVNDPRTEDEYTLKRRMALCEQQGSGSNIQQLARNDGQIIEDEEREIGYVQPEVWIGYIRKCGPYGVWIFIFVASVVPRAVAISQKYWISLWTSSESTPSGNSHSVAYWLGIYMAIDLIWTVASFGAPLLYKTYGIRASRTIHEELLSRILNAKPVFFDTTPIGRIISRFTSDMRVIDAPLMSSLTSILRSAVNVSSVIFILSIKLPVFIVSGTIISVVYISQGLKYLNSTRELKRLRATASSPLLSLFSEIIAGSVSIRAFGAQNMYIKEVIHRVYMKSVIEYISLVPSNWWYLKTRSFGSIITFSAVMLILLKIDEIDAGMAGFILSYATTFSVYLGASINLYSRCEISMNSVERINQYLMVEQEASLESTPENRPPANWPANGNIEVENLVIEYKPGVPVLHDLSLSVKHGERIGVVGRTGAGKSTLSLAFLRFIEAAKGRIVLDSVDISKIGLEDLRRNVTIIPQDPVLFNGTIRFNLDPFGEFSDELVWDALKRAHLVRENDSEATSAATSVYEGRSSASENVLERMGGIFASLDAEIKENGQNLSLGQRQLVAIARALVRRSRLIIMDEATASVDFDTDDRIQQTIRGPEFSNSTLLCVAHRLRTIIDYDRVLVLDKGKIAEFDTPWNLLQKGDGGIFKSMCLKSGEYDFLFSAAKHASSQK